MQPTHGGSCTSVNRSFMSVPLDFAPLNRDVAAPLDINLVSLNHNVTVLLHDQFSAAGLYVNLFVRHDLYFLGLQDVFFGGSLLPLAPRFFLYVLRYLDNFILADTFVIVSADLERFGSAYALGTGRPNRYGLGQSHGFSHGKPNRDRQQAADGHFHGADHRFRVVNGHRLAQTGADHNVHAAVDPLLVRSDDVRRLIVFNLLRLIPAYVQAPVADHLFLLVVADLDAFVVFDLFRPVMVDSDLFVVVDIFRPVAPDVHAFVAL